MSEICIQFARMSTAIESRCAVEGDNSDEPLPFRSPLSESAYRELEWYFGEYIEFPDAGAAVRAENIERYIPLWSRAILDSVFATPTRRQTLADCLATPPPRILTIASDEPEVLRVPWELLGDEHGPLCFRGVTIRRRLSRIRNATTEYKQPLRILLIVSRPDDMLLLNPRRTALTIVDALEPAGDSVQLDFCRPPTLTQMRAMLEDAEAQGKPYDIVHFDGHGVFSSSAQHGALCFEREEDQGLLRVDTNEVDGTQLGQILAAHRVSLVVLAACRSGTVSRLSAMASIAPNLLAQGIDSVLAMTETVHVEAMRIFMKHFYGALAIGRTEAEATDAGRIALREQPERWVERGRIRKNINLVDWFVPALYQCGSDRPFLVCDTDRPPAKDTEESPPRAAFYGRSLTLIQLERLLLRNRVVVVSGMAGTGKTSLVREAAAWWIRTKLVLDVCYIQFEQGCGVERIIRTLGAYFEGDEFEQFAPAVQRQRAQAIFRERRILVVWENFESVLTPFHLDNGPGSSEVDEHARVVQLFHEWTNGKDVLGRLLVTSRPADTGLPGAARFEVSGLGRPDALELLEEVMYRSGARFDDERLRRSELELVLDRLQNHPLSIEQAGLLLGIDEGKILPQQFCNEYDVVAAQFAKNRPLRASLELSMRRLGPEARELLQWLGWFRVGVFEVLFLDICTPSPETWMSLRQTLEHWAVIRIERQVLLNGQPYVRLHPAWSEIIDCRPPTTEEKRRIVKVYYNFCASVYGLLRGNHAAYAMKFMEREESNTRQAVSWATDDPQRFYAMGDALSEYLVKCGRHAAHKAWISWLAPAIRQIGDESQELDIVMDEAVILGSEGRYDEAIQKLEDVLDKWRSGPDFNTSFQVAHAYIHLGRAYHDRGMLDKAAEKLEDAVQRWSARCETNHSSRHGNERDLVNLSAALSSLASVCLDRGKHAEAAEYFKQSNEISAKLGRRRHAAVALTKEAQLLSTQGRLLDAEAKLKEAHGIAGELDDKRLVTLVTQHLAALANTMYRPQDAMRYGLTALKMFKETEDWGGVMTTYTILGEADMQSGRRAEALRWYEQAGELAVRRGDSDVQQLVLNQSGALCMHDGDDAMVQSGLEAARVHYKRAEQYFAASLELARRDHDEAAEAALYDWFGRLYLRYGEFPRAEEMAVRSAEISKRLGLRGIQSTFDLLAEIADETGDVRAAAQWRDKRDEIGRKFIEENPGIVDLHPEIIGTFRYLAAACARVGLNGSGLTPQDDEILKEIERSGPPLSLTVPFLRELAAGKLPDPPPGLPHQLEDILLDIRRTVENGQFDRDGE